MPENLSQTIGQGLIKLGYAQLGGGLAKHFDNPALQEVAQEIGESHVNVLRNRFFQKEAQDFQTLYGKQSQESMNALKDEHSRLTTPVVMEDDPIDAQRAAIVQEHLDEEAVSEGNPINPAPNRAPRKRGFRVEQPDGTSIFYEQGTPEAFDHVGKATANFYSGVNGVLNDYLNAASQYQHNPIIAQQAQQIVDYISNEAGYVATGTRVAEEQEARWQDRQRFEADMENRRLELSESQQRQDNVLAQAGGVISQASEEDLAAAYQAAGVEAGKDPNTLKKNEKLQVNAALKGIGLSKKAQSDLERSKGITKSLVAPDTRVGDITTALKGTRRHQDIKSEFEDELAKDLLMQVPNIQLMTPDQQAIEKHKILASNRAGINVVADGIMLSEAMATDPQLRDKVEGWYKKELKAGNVDEGMGPVDHYVKSHSSPEAWDQANILIGNEAALAKEAGEESDATATNDEISAIGGQAPTATPIETAGRAQPLLNSVKDYTLEQLVQEADTIDNRNPRARQLESELTNRLVQLQSDLSTATSEEENLEIQQAMNLIIDKINKLDLPLSTKLKKTIEKIAPVIKASPTVQTISQGLSLGEKYAKERVRKAKSDRKSRETQVRGLLKKEELPKVN